MKAYFSLLILCVALVVAAVLVACVNPAVQIGVTPETTIATTEVTTSTVATEPVILVGEYVNQILSSTQFVYIADLNSNENVAQREALHAHMEHLTIIMNELDVNAIDFLEASQKLADEIARLQGLVQQYEVEYKQLADVIEAEKWAKRAAEYPVATQVWLYMKNEFGWSDIVCAGIMGNLMGECGGEWSHDLDWKDDGNKSFGLVQWTSGRRAAIFAKYGPLPTVEEQLEFMRDEMFGTNGVTKQIFKDSYLDEIMNAATPEDCAYAFAKYFERCREIHWNERRGFAKTAYEYFVG